MRMATFSVSAQRQASAAAAQTCQQPLSAASRDETASSEGDAHRSLQTKFAASFVLPTPVYCATCG